MTAWLFVALGSYAIISGVCVLALCKAGAEADDREAGPQND